MAHISCVLGNNSQVYYEAQSQQSSTNFPSFSIVATYSFASSSDICPYFSSAPRTAALTAAGILFEDLWNDPCFSPQDLWA